MNPADYRLQMALKAIAQSAYPSERFAPFTIGLKKRSSKSFHGQWRPPQDGKPAQISYTNVERSLRYMIKTLIHELSHHVEYHFFKNTGHQKTFYDIYEKLFVTACRMNIITPEMIEEGFVGDNASDAKKIMSRIRKHDLNVVPELEYKKNRYIICALDAYKFIPTLKARNYYYNDHTGAWEKEFANVDIDSELLFLENAGVRYVTANPLDITINTVVSITGNTFHIKESLKSHGYRYTGSLSTWSKKYANGEMVADEPFLKDLEKKNFKIDRTYQGGKWHGQ